MNNDFTSSLIINEPPLQVLPTLATALKSSDKAIIIQQLHYWLARSRHFKDGRKWVYNTMDEWQRQFPWIADSTLRRHFKQLETAGILITGNYNELKFDRTKWYSIDYLKLKELEQSAICSKLANGTAKNEQTNTNRLHNRIYDNDLKKVVASELIRKLDLLSYTDDRQKLDTANVVIRFKDKLNSDLLLYGIKRTRDNQIAGKKIKNVAGYLTNVYKHWIEAGITEVAEAKAESEARYREDVDKEVYRDMYEAGYTDIADYKEAYGG